MLENERQVLNLTKNNGIFIFSKKCSNQNCVYCDSFYWDIFYWDIFYWDVFYWDVFYWDIFAAKESQRKLIKLKLEGVDDMQNSKVDTNNCNFPKFEKNKYFYGKLMTVRDFEAEQSYFDEKHYLINRLLHGIGIVCGFTDVTINNSKEPFSIYFRDGGVALTYYGNEIVVPLNTKRQIVDEFDKPVKDLTSMPYLYLQYQPLDEGYVSVASNSSSCKEKCCPGRVVDDFKVVALKTLISPFSEIVCNSVSELLTIFENDQKCQLSESNQASRVYLGKVVKDKDDKDKIEQGNLEMCRIFLTQKELCQLLSCHVHNFDSHINNFENPHKVTALQTKALVSIGGVSNPGGDIGLKKVNSIEITTDQFNTSITIGENHSTKKDNPHNVTAVQTGALVSVDGLSNPGGNIDLINGENIKISHGDNSITFDCEIKAASTVHSIGTKNFVGTSTKYAREDHVHKLENCPNPPIFLLRLLALLLVILIILVAILILR